MARDDNRVDLGRVSFFVNPHVNENVHYAHHINPNKLAGLEVDFLIMGSGYSWCSIYPISYFIIK